MRGDIKKIAFVLPSFQAGGAERVMITIANHLDRERFEPVIIVFHDDGPLRGIVAKDIHVASLNSKKVSYGAFAFIKEIRAVKADLVLSTMAYLNMVVLMTKPFLGHLPVVVREAVTPSYFYRNLSKKIVLVAGYYLLYPCADMILSPTKLVFDQMPKVLLRNRKKFQRIFNPVHIDFIHEKPDVAFRRTLARDDQKLFVGAGRLVEQKGFDRLIQTLRGWNDRDDWRLIIAGDGPDHALLQDMINEAGLQRHITLIGFEERPWRYYAVADAFLLPSRHEGLPNVALEALAVGAPVVASQSAGGIGEIAAEARGASVQLAQTMDEFCAMMEQVQLANLASRVSLLPECFSLGAVVASYETIFTGLLAQKS